LAFVHIFRKRKRRFEVKGFVGLILKKLKRFGFHFLPGSGYFCQKFIHQGVFGDHQIGKGDSPHLREIFDIPAQPFQHLRLRYVGLPEFAVKPVNQV
jgi:hypothetical protein